MEKRLLTKVGALFLMCLLFSGIVLAQTNGKSIKGVVKDAASNEPIPGATILEKGTTNGTATDLDGNFSINLTTSNPVLLVSFIGYTSQEVSVGNASVLDISLSEDVSQLDEVVVVGYGTQKRSQITGSIASVPKERLSNLPVTNVMHAIQGTTAGVMVNQGSSVPGSAASVQIRGVNSINAGTSPFIVVDGVPFYGSYNDINPVDIESIEILKDASAVAIYGNRGSNGVILITTKRGSASDGKPKISFNTYSGVESMAHVLKPMGPDQYVQKYADFMEAENRNQTEVLPNAAEIDNYNNGITTDWLNEGTQTGHIREHNISINGGTENVQYFVSASDLKQKGIVKGYQYHRTNVRANIDAKINETVKVGMSSFFSNNNHDGGRVNFLYANSMSPYSSPRDEDGNYIIFPMAPEELFRNPLLELTADQLDRRKNLSGNGYIEITPKFLKGFKYRLNASYVYRIDRFARYTGRQSNDLVGTARVNNREDTNWVMENVVSYTKDFDKHHIDFTGLYSAQQTDRFFNGARANGFINDELSYNRMQAGGNHTTESWANKETFASQMGRINYAYAEKYLLTVTARRDGYSAFGKEGLKFGVFPSVGLGWNMHNESFMEGLQGVDQMKLRFSYGKTGNYDIGVNRTTTTASTVQQPFGGAISTGILYNDLGNAELSWETTTSANLGLDFGVMKGRIQGSVEVYKSISKDLLMWRSLPTITGYGSILTNLGEMQNTGVELTLTGNVLDKGDFRWETTLNFSSYKNEIRDLYGDEQDDIGNGWFIGQPRNVIFGYEKIGIWQTGEDASNHDPIAQPGDIKFKDQNEDGKIDADDRVIIGQRDPKWYGGWTNTFHYKNFHLNIFIQTSQGGLKNNRDLAYGDEAGRRNLPEGFGYWTPENPDNYWPSLSAYKNYRGYHFAEDWSYIRIKDVTLSYVVPRPLLDKYGISGLTVYASGRNLHTFTKWFGWDPEMRYYPRGSSDSQGSWENNYPLVRTVSLGMNLSF